jgi:hypothetical protein
LSREQKEDANLENKELTLSLKMMNKPTHFKQLKKWIEVAVRQKQMKLEKKQEQLPVGGLILNTSR